LGGKESRGKEVNHRPRGRAKAKTEGADTAAEPALPMETSTEHFLRSVPYDRMRRDDLRSEERLREKAAEPLGNRGTLLMYYNFERVHQTLRVTPAMEAGVPNHVWSIQDIVALLKHTGSSK
jgi:hypothetical protein